MTLPMIRPEHLNLHEFVLPEDVPAVMEMHEKMYRATCEVAALIQVGRFPEALALNAQITTGLNEMFAMARRKSDHDLAKRDEQAVRMEIAKPLLGVSA